MDQNEKTMWVQTLWGPLNEKNNSLMESKEPGIRVVAYCRVSSKVDFGSLVNQVSYYTNFIKSRPNWKFIGIYFDNGISGATCSKRPGFKRLLRHCEEGCIDLILTKNISRFSRNTKELIDVVNWLKEKEVAIFFEKENIDTSQNYNQFLLTTYAAIAQEEIENASHRSRGGYERRFIKGCPVFRPMFGYDINQNNKNSILTINEHQAEIVRWIFDKFLSGNKYLEISRQLMDNGVKTAFGNEFWTGVAVKDIITNMAYSGNKIARAMTNDIITKTRRPTEGQRDLFVFHNSHPLIISKDIYDKAQIRVEECYKKVPKHKRTVERPFSKRIICGYCGRKYNSRRHSGWKCRTTLYYNNKCDAKVINDKDISIMILNAFEQRFDFKDPNILKELLKIIQKVNQNDNFEFHRLKYLTEIEIAYNSATTKDGQKEMGKLKEHYREFEEKINMIEDDRIYRDSAILWAINLDSIAELREQINVEYIRAWVMEITVFSKENYIVHWVDNAETVIGDYELAKTKASISIANKSNKSINKILHTHAKTCDGGDDLKINSNVEVIQTEASENTIKTIKKRLKECSIENIYDNSFKSKKDKKIIRVASYCRVSTLFEKQQVSLKTQVAYYTYLILKNPEYEYAGIYADEGLTGTSMKNRAEFMKMMDDCRAGKIDLIITKSISRFSRNTLEALSTIRMLKELTNPVYCYFEKENIITSDEKAELMASLYCGIAQEEVNNISNNTSWGVRKLAARGIIRRRAKCYGYDVNEDYSWVINYDEAENCRRIYQDYLSGKSVRKIIKDLYNEGIKSPKGNDSWSNSQLVQMLRNEIYKGDYLFQKNYRPDIVNSKRKKNTGEIPQYYIENHHPAIIEPHDWDLIQQAFKKRARTMVKPKKDKPGNKSFYRRFHCSECKGIISRFSDARKEQREAGGSYWRCLNTATRKKLIYCNSFSIREEYIEHNFMNVLLDIKNNQEFKEDAEKIISKISLSEVERNVEEEIRYEMEELNKKLYEVVDEELNKYGKDTQKVDFLTEEIIKRQDELKKLTLRTERVVKYRQEVNWLLKEIEKIYDFNIGFRADIFDRIVDHGEIDRYGSITYYFKFEMKHNLKMTYQDYLNKQSSIDAADKRAKLVNSQGMKKLLDFCKEPKSTLDMIAFMNAKSRASFSKRVIKPLLEEGKLKMTIPEDIRNMKQKYYAVK